MQLNPLGLIDRAALEHLKSKQLLPSYSHWDVWLDQHAYAFTVAKMMDEDMLSTVRTALVDAIERGTDFRDFKARLKPYLMAQGWWGEQVMIDPLDGAAKTVQLGSTRRLRTIFETNLATAHAAGQWARIETDAAALPYLRYNPSAADHKRDSHKRYYGLVLPVQHPIWQQIFPPNGYGCQCSVSQLTRQQAERAGISEEPQIETVDVTNPRTGEVVQVPADITPSFAHNHADRTQAVLDLAAEKHGQDYALQLAEDTRTHILARLPDDHVGKMFTGDVTFAQSVQDNYQLGELNLSKEDLVKLSGVADGSEVFINHYPNPSKYLHPCITIVAKNPEVYDFQLNRIIKWVDGKLVVGNDYQELLPEQRGKGVALWALLQQVLAAKKLGASRIETYAAGSAAKKRMLNGYYTWPRMGFNCPFSEKDYNKHPDLKEHQDLNSLMATEDGRKWWKKRGWASAVEFDLSENSTSVRMLADYIKQRFNLEINI